MTYIEKYLINPYGYLNIETINAFLDRSSYYEIVDSKFVIFTLYNTHYKNLYCSVTIKLDTLIEWYLDQAPLKSCIEHHFNYDYELYWLCDQCKAAEINAGNLQCDCQESDL